jgi:uncharacterized lipoprotein YddW (UPF0748 family)
VTGPRLRRRAWLGAASALLAACAEVAVAPPAGAPQASPAPAPTPAPDPDLPPPAPREFRAAWIASVSNIDWPSRPGLPTETQRAEALAILERARAIGLNALILQVRPAADALYASALEPWSEYLTGEQGRAPEPAWDPLAFWVEQAHRRGLELHAWFNPYRARHSSAKSALAASHLALRQPALVKRYGDMLWMDPGEPAAAAQTLAVVADVVRRYDIDGVHIDDYFYPYPVAQNGGDLPFPDDDSFARYLLADGKLARDDWRRANVDALVAALYRTVHEIKPWVRVGISPFGLPRPERRAAGIAGFSQYDKLYADVERWLETGWLDYLSPQLYWTLKSEGQPFAPLLDHWLAANTAGRALWPGLFTSQVGKAWPARELLDQLALLRARPAAGGHIHFSMVALMQDRDGIATALRSGLYAQPALVPALPWLDALPPGTPLLRATGARVEIEAAPGAAVARWAVWRRGADGGWRFSVQPLHERTLAREAAAVLAVQAVGRTGLLSTAQTLRS